MLEIREGRRGSLGKELQSKFIFSLKDEVMSEDLNNISLKNYFIL